MKMRQTILMVVNYEKDNNSIGITKKIKGQIEAINSLGYHILTTAYLADGIEIYDYETKKQLVKKEYGTKSRRLQHAIRRALLLQMTKEWLKEENVKVDGIYIRYLYFDSLMLNLLKESYNKAIPVVMEIHSYPCLSFQFSWRGLYYILDKIFQNQCTRYITAFANMSENNLPFATGKKVVKIQNTVNLSDVGMRHPAQQADDTIQLLSVAYERPAHGFDRVIQGLHEYYAAGGKRNICVYFVGQYLQTTHELVNKYHLEHSCKFIPPVEGEELDYYYDHSDIAIGHLANHRIGSFSGSSIKIQEYMAKGIPFIYAWNEMTVPADYRYALKFELNDSPIDINKVISFYDSLGDMEMVAKEMRKEFSKNAGWEQQMGKVVQLMRGLQQ